MWREQPVINHLLHLLDVRAGGLPLNLFPNGLAWHVHPQPGTDEAVVVHYNYCLATEKPTLMRKHSHWFLMDSCNYQYKVVSDTALFRPEPHVNRGHGGMWIESSYYEYWVKMNEVTEEYTYLPVFWTDVYAHNTDRAALEGYLETLDKTRRYYTVLQNSHGFMVAIPEGLNLDVFSAGTHKLPDEVHTIPIPLLKDVLPLVEDPPTIDVVFAGCLAGASDKGGLRTEMYMKLADCPGFSFYEGPMWRQRMSQGKYNLCPSGFGPTSFRLYETLQLGRVPIYIHADPEPFLPFREFVPWHVICICVPRSSIEDIPALIQKFDYTRAVEEIKKARRFFTYEYVCLYIEQTVKAMSW